MIHLIRLTPRQRESFKEIAGYLRTAQKRLDGRAGNSAFDQLALQPGFGELQHHLDRAVRWATELQDIIEGTL